jgi:DNA-binding NarL/FixJ family response regulator
MIPASLAGASSLARRGSIGPIRVVLVDDHELVREGLRLVLALHEGIEVVGEAGDSQRAFEVIEAAGPDVVLLDLSLADGDATPLLRSLKTRNPGLRVIVLTVYRDAETVRQSLLAGADGYVGKGATSVELIEAITAVLRGERYLHSSVTSAVVDDSIRWLQQGGPLSPREREILALVSSGNSAASIGRILGISPHTVRRHIANTKAKLDVRGIPELIRYAMQHGIARDRT